MSRLDPDFRIDQQGNPSSARRPYPDQLTPRKGHPRPKSEEFERYERARAEINAQVVATPTPITDELGRGTPKEPDFHEKVKKVAREYGVDERGVLNYISKYAFPGGRSGHQLWEGGYGTNAVRSLRLMEQQLNFFKQTGMTPLEAAVKRYDGITSMESARISAERAAKKEVDRYSKVKTGDLLELNKKKEPEEDLLKFPSREEELKGLFGGRGKKSRKGKSKKARKTRRRRA